MPTPTLARSLAMARGDSGLPSLVKAEPAAADAHGAGIPAFEMVDAAKQRALARAARAEQRHDFADADRQVEAVEHRLAP